MSEPGCIFCRIVTGELPAELVHSSERVVAFRDINPQAPVHVQLVPRRHVVDASTIGPGDGDLLAELFQAAQAVARQEGLSERGYRLLFNVGEDSGNTIPHLHLHLLGGRRLGWPPG